MHEFSHEQLQMVIKKYDEQHKKTMKVLQDKDNELNDMRDQVQDMELRSSRMGNQEDMKIYEDQIERLKVYIDGLTKENSDLKKAREQADQALVENSMNGGGSGEGSPQIPLTA